MGNPHNIVKMRSHDRIFVVDVKEGEKSNSLMDTGIFTGKNKLHAIMEPEGMWKFQYDHGMLPGPLQTRFTSYNKLYNYAEDYFKRKNIVIKEVID